MALGFNMGVHDFLSITIHNDKLSFLEVLEIDYPEKFNHQPVNRGFGNPRVAHELAGVARGRFEGDFKMKLLLGEWELLSSLYSLEPYGIFTSKPSIFTVTYKEQNYRTFAQHKIYVVMKSATQSNMTNKGGEGIEVSIEGFQTKPAEIIWNGIRTNGMPVI